MSRLLTAASVGLALLVGGCVSYAQPETFSYHFPDNQKKDTKQVVKRLPEPAVPAQPDNALGKPVAVGTTLGDDPREVVAVDVQAGETLWSVPFDAITRPEVLGDVVLSSDHDHVVAFDLQSGEELWRVPTEDLAYIGADRDGGVLVYVLSVGAAGGANREGRVVAVQPRTGDELWSHTVEKSVLGAPAVIGGLAFVPWNRQNIAILDLTLGKETARLRSTDDVINWVQASRAGVHYGGRGIYRLTVASHTGTQKGSAYRPPPVPGAPREPLVHEDGFMPTPGTRSARGRIRIYYAPAPATDEQSVPVLADRFYFVYYRYVFAFDTEENLLWARILDQDVLDAQVLEQGLVVVGDKGKTRLLDGATGNDRWSSEIDGELASASVDAAGFAPGGDAGEPRDLRTTLNEVALDPDNRLAPARAFAIEQLALMDDPEITRDLLELYAQRSMPSVLRDAIANSLRKREKGEKYVVEALDQHYDYLEDARTPPLQVIVPSVLEMGAEEALPGLVSQMHDPATPLEELPLVIKAIVELGGEEAVPELREFLVLYHADSTFAEQPEALAVAAQGIFAHGGAEGRKLLRDLMADSSTREAVAGRIDGLFQQEQKLAEKRAREQAEAAARQAAEAERRAREARPVKLSQEQINQTFAEHADALRECISAELARTPKLRQVRIALILESSGEPSEIRVAPSTDELSKCLMPTLETIDFPAFRQRRQRATFTVAIGGQEQGPQRTQPAQTGPWWARQARRAEPRERPLGNPWWKGGAAAGGAQPPAAERPRPPRGGGEPATDAPWWMEDAPERPEAPQPQPEQPSEPRQPAQGEPPAERPDEQPTEPPPSEGQPWWLPTQEQ